MYDDGKLTFNVDMSGEQVKERILEAFQVLRNREFTVYRGKQGNSGLEELEQQAVGMPCGRTLKSFKHLKKIYLIPSDDSIYQQLVQKCTVSVVIIIVKKNLLFQKDQEGLANELADQAAASSIPASVSSEDASAPSGQIAVSASPSVTISSRVASAHPAEMNLTSTLASTPSRLASASPVNLVPPQSPEPHFPSLHELMNGNRHGINDDDDIMVLNEVRSFWRRQ